MFLYIVSTTTKPGAWGRRIPEGADPGYVGKATGLLCGRRRGQVVPVVPTWGVVYPSLNSVGGMGTQVIRLKTMSLPRHGFENSSKIRLLSFYVGKRPLWWNEND